MIRLILIAPLLSGCATMAQQAATADTFCLQKERKWGVADSADTIRDVQVFNETLRRRCGGGLNLS
jgi:hypothetical protein